ncbi:hypothetical protein JCM14469_26890 [Desulfatiferula olefinivorans]
MTDKALIWKGPAGLPLPVTATSANDIVPYAQALTEKQKNHVIRAFNDGAFDMGAEYLWRRSMIKLRNALQSLGMKFIGEMLGNTDIDEFSNIESVLTDYDTIKLSEQLGVVNSTGALKLKQSLEIINHFFSRKAEEDGEELSAVDGIQIITTCVKYILGEQNLGVALEFSEFRKRLYNETLSHDDLQVQYLLNSPTFYVRTVVNVLLSVIRESEGAKLEHSLANLNTIIPLLWSSMAETDRWGIGTAYRDVTSDGNIIAAKGLKEALLKVSGFDYVPENLRSTTFKKAAKAIIEAHYNNNNFYTEGPLVKVLNNLGTTIPAPAIIDCIQAYLCVYFGNSYGVSFTAGPLSLIGINNITPDRWQYYLNNAIHTDEVILDKLAWISRAPSRFVQIITEKLDISVLDTLSKNKNRRLVQYIFDNNTSKIQSVAKSMYDELKQ